MNDINHILIDGCKFCDIFKSNQDIIKKLYYPIDIKDITNVDYIICDIDGFNNTLIIIRDHVPSISKNLYKLIKRQVNKIFGIVRIKKLYYNDVEHLIFRIIK